MLKFLKLVLMMSFFSVSYPGLSFAREVTSGAGSRGDVNIGRRPPLPPQPRPAPPQRPAPPRRPPPPRPRPVPPPPPQPEYVERTIYLDQLYNNTSLDIGALFGLNRYYRNHTLDYVTVRVSNPDPRSQELVLFVDNRMEDRRIPYEYTTNLAVHGWKEIGRDFNWVTLHMQGWVRVHAITVRMTRNYRW